MSNLLLFTSTNIYSTGTTFSIQPVDISNGFNPATNVSFSIINGNDNIQHFGDKLVFFCAKTGDVAIKVNGSGYSNILYLTVVNSIILPSTNDMYNLLMQEYPQNVYSGNITANSQTYVPTIINGKEVYPNTAIYADNMAISNVLEDASVIIQSIFNNAYPGYTEYNQQWEYVFNGTYSLFTNSLNPPKLIELLNRISTQTSLNVYDLSIFISKYLYYRQPMTNNPITFPVSLDDGTRQYPGFWHLGSDVDSELNVTTKLYDNTPDIGIAWNLKYYIFNLPLDISLRQLLIDEISIVINNISRADMSHELTTYTDSPLEHGFDYPFYTYKLDPKISLEYKALEFIGSESYPFNIKCYLSIL